MNMLRSRRHPLATPLVAKAGCTFLRNLVYLLDNDEVHSDPLAINREPSLWYQDVTASDLGDLVGFFVVRNPQARFFSLYWDKAWAGSPNPFPWLIERLEATGSNAGVDLTLQQHRMNCNRLLGFLERRTLRKGAEHVNAHWRPQAYAGRRAIELGCTPILLDQLVAQLPQVADGRIAGLEPAIARIGRANASARPYTNAQVCTKRIADRIRALYASDYSLFAQTQEHWSLNANGPAM